MGYTAYERETTIVGNDEDRIWEIYTAQPTIMTKLKKAGMEPYWTETEPDVKGKPRIIAAKYRLDWRQVTFRRKEKRKATNHTGFARKIPNSQI